PATDGEFLHLVAWATLETLAISIAGAALSVLIGGALLYFATSEEILGGGGEVENKGMQRSAGRNALLVASRMALNLFRTIPELVWGIIWVFIVGLGPFAGVLALGIHNGGVLGKLYAEAMESVRPGPIEAIRASGGRRASAFLYAALPQTWPQLIAYTLYRWEVSIRAAAILGFVGAGGLGQQMHISLSLFLENRLVTLIAAIFILVSAVDLFSGWLRRKLDGAF
ncbi:MAG: ABC transporter permease subunit, partial [bacterium]|nr:ABC transporter permease subunit [bacterium]